VNNNTHGGPVFMAIGEAIELELLEASSVTDEIVVSNTNGTDVAPAPTAADIAPPTVADTTPPAAADTTPPAAADTAPPAAAAAEAAAAAAAAAETTAPTTNNTATTPASGNRRMLDGQS